MPSMLPAEMLRMIFSNVDDKNTLCDIIVSSRQFSQIVEPFLYARIVIPPWSPNSTKLMRLQSLLEALETSSGRRSHYVRAFSFLADASRSEKGFIDEILEKTVNLKSLALHLSASDLSSNGRFSFFQQCPPLTLASVCFAGVSCHQEQDLLHFLESQTSLEMLHLNHARQREHKYLFSSTSFRNLKALSVHSSFVRAFLRASPRLTCLRVSGNVYRPDPDSADQLCTNTVRTLSCPISFNSDAVASLFPNLEWLSGQIETIESLEHLSTRTRKLRGVRFITGLPPCFSGDNIHRFFRALPALQFLDYAGSGYERRRWYRDAAAPTLVRWLCKSGDEWLANWVEDVVDVV